MEANRDALDGVANLAAGILPPGTRVAVVAYDPQTQKFCVTGDLTLARLEKIAAAARRGAGTVSTVSVTRKVEVVP